MRNLFQPVVLLVFLRAAGFTQTLAPAGNLSLSLDYARFRHDDRSGYVEVYYSFLPSLLTFEISEGKYHGGIELSTRIINTATQAVAAEKKAPLQIAEADTAAAWYRYPFITQNGFQLPHGKYRMEVSATDAKAAGRKVEVKAEFEIAAYPARAALSDLQLCKKISPSQNKEDLFYKNTLEVVPQPSVLFGVATSPVVFHYAELYHVAPGEVYFLKTQLLDGDGKIVGEKSEEKKYAGQTGLVVGNKMVTALPTGKYTLRCAIAGADQTELARTEKIFFILNPHIQAATIDASTVLSKELERSTLKQLDEEFQSAKYLATAEESKVFSQLTTVEAKRQFLVKFWQEVEPGRSERPPIKRAEYLQRVRLATKEFTAFGKEGWRTDRGRVMAVYGPPDEIQRAPAETNSKANETWRYFLLDGGAEFIFIDRSGYGDYQLVHSSKRGELKDPDWQRFLQ